MMKMRQYPLFTILIGGFLAVAFGTSIDGPSNINRSKRQAPSINVHKIPKTSFSCSDKKIGDYYADTEADCQVYHVCIPGMHNRLSLMSFVCPNGTIFNQATRVCSPFDRVDCNLALKFYDTIHGNLNSRRTDYEDDVDYDNYVPPAPRAPATQPRQVAPAARPAPVPARPQPQIVSRNTIPPPETEEPRVVPSRFRSGANQFRGPQSRPVQTPAPARQPAPQPPARQPVPATQARQAVTPAAITPRQALSAPRPQAIRPPIIAVRPSTTVTQPPVVQPPRPTIRTSVSTSTSNYNYEYEYEYDYEDELPEQGNKRTKRDLSSYINDYDTDDLDIDREPQKTSFSCIDKVPGGVYADIETDCEMFHICVPLGKHKMLDYKVFCANETAFDQETGSCKEKPEFKCEKAQLYYQFDKVNQSSNGKKPIYKKSSYSKSKKLSPIYKSK